MHKIKKYLQPNLDTFTGLITGWLLLAYVLAYGYVQLGGFVVGEFNAGYLAILLPIWLIDGVKITVESMMPRQFKTAKEDISKVTVVIACKDGEEVIGDTLASLRRKLPLQQIIVASNGSTDRTCEIARQYGVVCLDFKEPLGKVRAINAALPYVKTPYVLLLDDDTLIAGATIPTGLLDEGYEAVAFRVLVKLDTWLSHIQLHEYRKSFDVGRRYHNKAGSVQCISGAVGLFRRDTLIDQIQRHTGEFSGEDLQRTLLIHLIAESNGRHKNVVLARSTVITKAPTTLNQLYRQRVFGWFPGLYANFRNYIRLLGSKKAPMPLRVESFYGCFLVAPLDVLRVLSLPIMLFYPGYFVVTYIAYVLLECAPYLRSGRVEPLWVVLVYPFYGIFGLFTRVSAAMVFFYRRMVVKIDKLPFLDDYRVASSATKMLSVAVLSVLATGLLGLNVWLNYSSLVTGAHF